MRISELQAVAKCSVCEKGVMHTGLPLFYRVHMERHGINQDAVRLRAHADRVGWD